MKKNEGITLIALVITIVVLLILAGISIKALTGEKELIKETYNTTDQAQRESIIQKIEADLYQEKTISREIPDKAKLKEIIQSKGYNKGELGEESFISKDGEYTISYEEILGWEDKIVSTEKTVKDLKVGEKVKYDTGKSNICDNGIIKCTVLYDSEYNETNHKEYGTQIIADNVVEQVTLGSLIGLEEAKKSYNEAIVTLNEARSI